MVTPSSMMAKARGRRGDMDVAVTIALGGVFSQKKLLRKHWFIQPRINQCYFIIVFRSFPQENEKNNREPLISVKLISGSLSSKSTWMLILSRIPHRSRSANKSNATNAVESMNYQLRKVTKNRSTFSTDDIWLFGTPERNGRCR